MYYPYFRGRRVELLALRDLVTSGLLSPNITPIVEPVKINSTVKRTIEAFENDHSGKIAVVLNPEKGISSEKNSNVVWYDTLQLKGKSNVMPAFLLNEYAENVVIDFIKRPGCVKEAKLGFATLHSFDFFESLQGRHLLSALQPAVIAYPDEGGFIRGVGKVLKGANCSAKTILFRDAFHKRRINADYADNTDEFFSGDHLEYAYNGYSGFGDYSIVGETYTEGGFAPYAVAIHVVYFNERRQLRIHHFVSDSNDSYKDTAGKFGEAAEKLLKWYRNQLRPMHTKGLDMLLDYSRRNDFPGLATIKKLCIMHHLELMGRFLDKRAVR